MPRYSPKGIQHSLVVTIVTYGLMFGVGLVLSYTQPMVLAMKWFPRKKGLVCGIIESGFGLSALIFDQVPWS